MNPQAQAQLITLLFGTGGIVAAILVQWGLPPGLTSQICQLLAVAVPLGIAWWMSRSKTSDHAVIASTANMEGVKSVTIEPNATDGAAKAAADPALPNVNKAP